MKNIIIVFFGGGTGSVARYLVGKAYLQWKPVFPLATLTSNFLSCFVFGIVVCLSAQKLAMSDSAKLLLLTGFCGGFSTYSAFTYETVGLFSSGKTGMALANIVLNFVLSVAAFYLGMLVAKLF
ncbi:fluoride efflux transporter CrcB [Hufsiella ginkgonis]|uniref:Fluoride-specific ion channel FluC n=1 Tax=Hufsiella ginkgonis TaxID=2695274 RepID=A0A7K1XU00_9SPHI|nr:fluoride efflux transporter CrcB [Hufsiella ginkgonis]MXV14452.1 fluoride efflux transporter CrcB [Hufsiella ginkgonis]